MCDCMCVLRVLCVLCVLCVCVCVCVCLVTFVHLCILLYLVYDQVLRWVLDHLPNCEKKDVLRRLLDESRSVKLKFIPYNWDLNSS